jgi:cyclopropane-fatty-acyl-phospholipid synthase
MWISRTLSKRDQLAEGAMRAGLARLADTVIAAGGAPLELVMPDGGRIGFGLPVRVRLRIRDASVLGRFARPTLMSLAEAYVDGQIDVEGDFLEALPIAEQLAASGGSSVAQRIAMAAARHTAREDKAAISYHYDVSNEFYRLWLDDRMVYSCAYFRSDDATLDEAQLAKLDHVCRKLRLAPGERFLDIGCGWGALPIHAAQNYGVRAVGITLSENQHRHGMERVRGLGLAGRVELQLLDYRDLPKRYGTDAFDKAASIGMFEHVGLANLPMYFSTVAQVLRDRGLFLNHGITSSDVDSRPVGSGVSDFIGKYVFPHGELPHLHVAVREMSDAGFEVADVESLRPHYARTLAQWSRRLESQLERAAALVSDRTLRIWRAYLAGCSYGFQQGWVSVYQLLGSCQRSAGPTELPPTRDWIYR